MARLGRKVWMERSALVYHECVAVTLLLPLTA